MSDLTTRVERAARHVRPQWGTEHVEATVRAVRLRQRRQRANGAIAHAAVVSIATAMAATFLLYVWHPWFGAPSSPAADHTLAIVAASAAGVLPPDGPSVVPLDDASRLVWNDAAGERPIVTVDRGGARGEVPGGTREVRIEAGPVALVTDDASFVVERVAGNRARVAVARGHVHVMWAVSEADLTAGETETFPLLRGAETEAPPALRSSPKARAIKAEAHDPNEWHELAKRGAYDEAYAELQREGGPKDQVNDLLLAADVARLGHHAGEAVAPLQQILQAHPSDPRASLAAFTLGRLLLDQLAQPAAAGDAFATARALSPGGALAEDALAREVEARSRAGETTAARALAEQYLKSFPDGARVGSVRRQAGLE